MHIYQWKSQYDVGLELIDVEHKNLIACINKLSIETCRRSNCLCRISLFE